MGKRSLMHVGVTAKPTIDEFDSSDEEDLRNTIGNIPIRWYDDCDHIGYDIEGNMIKKGEKKDEMERFLDRIEDPDYMTKVYDKQTGEYIKLSNEQIEKLYAIHRSRYPNVGYNPYEPFLDIYTSKIELHPISNAPASKASFEPSKDESRLVGRIVHAIKMGWMRPPRPKPPPKVYDLWADEKSKDKTKSEKARIRMHFPAPKIPLPNHAESYNPPAEYLFDADERKKWEDSEKEDRRINFIPQKYDSMRKIPSYDLFYNERYERCLDLYMAPRQQRMRLKVELSDLLPDLPNPADLRPYPTTLAFYMKGHTGEVRSLSIEPAFGEYLASGSIDGTVRLWAINNGYCSKVLKMDNAVSSVAICPNASYTLIAAVVEPNKINLLNYDCGDCYNISRTNEYLLNLPIKESHSDSPRWLINEKKVMLSIEFPTDVRRVVWHAKGDYFASYMSLDSPSSIYIHRLSTCLSQKPFVRTKGKVSSICFHPKEPQFLVATQKYIRIYDLAKCHLIKKVNSGTQWLSCMVMDHGGDNVFLGGLDRVFSWLDLQLSTRPWKSVKHHQSAVRDITYHARYPLLATVSDDSSAIVYYAKVDEDLMKENELVPVRRLNAHTKQENGLSMLTAIFHPSQPWLITGGADGLIALFSY